ncbi:MAG: DNA polymerase III subunit alpha [Patescibacteria group bacterium]
MLLSRSYSHHSLLSAVPQIKKLVKDAKAKGYTSIALTDEETGSGLVEFYSACKANDIKPVLGVTLKIPNISDSQDTFGKNKNFSKITVLAKDITGYKALLKLITVARTVQEKPTYHITFTNLLDQIKEEHKFFVCLAGNDHELIHNLEKGNVSKAQSILEKYCSVVGAHNLLVELAYPQQKISSEDLKQINLKLISLCKESGVKYIACCAPRYLDSEDEETFRTVLAIRNQVRLSEINLTRNFDLVAKSDLKHMFEYAPEVVDTSDIEAEIDIDLRADYDKNASEAFFPKFNLAHGQEPKLRLTWETYIGLLQRFDPTKKSRNEWKVVFPYEKLAELKKYAESISPDTSQLLGYPSDYWDKKQIKDYVNRIEKEIDIIVNKGYPDYFIVFSDIMQFCRDNDIVINTRGSAAGCLVGYLTGINILDPLVYDIPFERFLNPLRPSAPDIDGDFADDKRDLVIKYITQTYGAEKVCQIITFGTMLPRAAVRDVGRVLGVSYKKCDRLSKLIPTAPQGRKTTFEWAFETSSELKEFYEKDDEVNRIINICKKIEGNYRHASSHAAGVIISPTAMTDYAPLQWDSEHQMIICQYDMKIAEQVGLIKLDILGIRNLAILGNAVQLAKDRTKQDIDLLNIDLHDEKSFELLAKGRTMGLFQLSGATMTRYLVELEPTKVQDLMAMVALYRPGPMVNIPEYIKRKKNPKAIKYYLPQMKKWMEPSYGILVYQDDVLYTAIEIAGYDWGEADVLRKGMGKKIKEVIDSQHIRFVEGAQTHSNLSEAQAEDIWNLVVPFSAYGFNKAHSSNYGMVAYWTAYLKANYPAEFMTALMTSEASNLDKVAAAIKECQELGLQVLPPDINKSFNSFTIENNTTIRYGLSSVKNLGSDVIKFMIEDRNQNGHFIDIEDFLQRISQFNGFNKRSLEALIWSGSLDSLGKKVVEKLKLKA